MIEFVNHRTGRLFEGLDEFLDDEARRPNPVERQLTAIVELNNQALPANDIHELEVPPRFPWITPVLGSGNDEGDPVKRRDSVLRRLDRIRTVLTSSASESTRELSDDAVKFASNLVLDRFGPAPPNEMSRDVSADEIPLAEREAELVLLTSLLTRLYHAAAEDRVTPMSRWADDAPSVDPSGGRWYHIDDLYLRPALELLDRLKREPWDYGPIGDLLEAVEDTCRRYNTITRAELRLLTETVWHCLLSEDFTDPGWSDLMVELALLLDTRFHHAEGRPRPVPSVLAHQITALVNRFQSLATSTWSSASVLHDVVVEMLCEQARLQTENTGPFATPLAAAFVTSFDLALELAFLRAGRAFTIALPFLVTEDEGPVRVVWLRRTINPDIERTPEMLFGHAQAQWEVLSGDQTYGHDRTIPPTIVRLAGCPAITPPRLDDHPALSKAVRSSIGLRTEVGRHAPRLELVSASVINEHVASILGVAESYLDHDEGRRLGLPMSLLCAPGGLNPCFARYWLLLGTQLGEGAIRQRMIAQLGAAIMTTPAPDLGRGPVCHGMAVNRTVGELDALMLQWRGLDIVRRTSSSELVGHLQHYVRHLKKPWAKCSRGAGCELP